jgi:hypothetical protein
LVQHSRRPYVWAPVKAVMWPQGHKDATYKAKGGADGGEARMAILALNYIAEEVGGTAFDDLEAVQAGLDKIGLKKPHDRLTVFRFVRGEDLAKAFGDFTKAEQKLRTALGRPHERRDILRATGEFLYCRLFGGTMCSNPNEYGYDVERGKKKIQVKTARKAKTNKAGLWISRAHLDDDEAYTDLAVFWLSPASQVKEYLELSRSELQSFAHKRGGPLGFDLLPDQLPTKIRQRSYRRFKEAASNANLSEFDGTSFK